MSLPPPRVIYSLKTAESCGGKSVAVCIDDAKQRVPLIYFIRQAVWFMLHDPMKSVFLKLSLVLCDVNV